MIQEYAQFLADKDDYWRTAKQNGYRDIDRIVLDLQNITSLTTRNAMPLRLLGLVKNLGNDNLELTQAGAEFLASSARQNVLDEQILKIYLDSSINPGIHIPVYPLQVIYSLIKDLEHLSFQEYMLFVCWTTDLDEVPAVVELIQQYRDAGQDTRESVMSLLAAKKQQKATADIEDNLVRLFNVFSLASFLISEGTRYDKVLSRNSSPEQYARLVKLLTDNAAGKDYIEFDYRFHNFITFAADHQEITRFLPELTNEDRRIISQSIEQKRTLPDLSTIQPVEVSPQIAEPRASAPEKKDTAKAKYKPDYVARDANNRMIGLYAEKIVVKYEQDRLIADGKAEWAGKVDHISIDDDSAGYDIVSYETDSAHTKKHIEVKAVSGYPSKFVFFISQNEIDKAKSDPIYCLYIVFDYRTTEPKIWNFPNIFLQADPRVSIDPIKYCVSVTIDK